MSLLIEYPLWFLLFCFLNGAAFSFGLYYRRRNTSENFIVLAGLVLLRFLSVSLITFLLLTPLIRKTIRQLEKPVIAIGLDGSQSVVSSADSAEVRKSLVNDLRNLSHELSDRYEVALYTIGRNVSPGLQKDFSAKHTDISGFFDELQSRYANRNLGAVIIATDGIYNKGTNPYYAAQKLNVPVYSIALGDTSLHRDVLIRSVSVSKQVYLGDQFPFEIIAELDKYTGREVRLSVLHSGEAVFTKAFSAYGDHEFIRVGGILEAKEKGIQKYTIEIKTPGDEFNMGNNKRDFYVEVVESRIRVALVYESPHPDIAAIVNALQSSAKFEVTQLRPAELQSKQRTYDLYIFYQIPSTAGLSDPSKLLPGGSPVLYIIGSQTDLAGFNRLKTGLVINSRRNTMTDIQPILNPDFTLFSFNRETALAISEFPPLQCPAGTFETAGLTDVLCYQNIGNMSTKFPLILFYDMPERKTCIIAGENIWRWRIADYIQKSDFRIFDEMISRIAQYLSVKNDSCPFRVEVKAQLEEGDPIKFDAFLFNPSHELINDPDVFLELKNEEGKSYPYSFTRNEKAYYLNAGYFPAGNYTYEASVKTAQALYKKQGRISIIPLDIELVNLVADHALLQQISSKYEGKVVSRKDILSLAQLLKKRGDLKSIIHLQRKYIELAGEWWLFLLVLLLLSAEWAIRKRSGM